MNSVILVLCVAIFINFCSAGFMSTNIASMRCKYHYGQEPINVNNCAQGWYKNQCKINVCYKDVGENCGIQRRSDLQLKYGKCATDLMCCHGICTEWSKCDLPREGQFDILDFVLNEKRNRPLEMPKIPNEQLDNEEY